LVPKLHATRILSEIERLQSTIQNNQFKLVDVKMVDNRESTWGFSKKPTLPWNVTKVDHGKQAFTKGIQLGWRIVKWNGVRVTQKNFQQIQQQMATGVAGTITFEVDKNTITTQSRQSQSKNRLSGFLSQNNRKKSVPKVAPAPAPIPPPEPVIQNYTQDVNQTFDEENPAPRSSSSSTHSHHTEHREQPQTWYQKYGLNIIWAFVAVMCFTAGFYIGSGQPNTDTIKNTNEYQSLAENHEKATAELEKFQKQLKEKEEKEEKNQEQTCHQSCCTWRNLLHCRRESRHNRKSNSRRAIEERVWQQKSTSCQRKSWK
jgi:hypothetical protein